MVLISADLYQSELHKFSPDEKLPGFCAASPLLCLLGSEVVFIVVVVITLGGMKLDPTESIVPRTLVAVEAELNASAAVAIDSA
jgi:hypothetical protein